MSIDPRLLTTPLGAVVGLILTRRILHERDRKPANLLAGTGVGAGAGYLAGEFARSYIPSGDDPQRAYVDMLKRTLRKTDVTPDEVETLAKFRNIYPYSTEKPSLLNPLERASKSVTKRIAPDIEETAVLNFRANTFDELARKATDPDERAKYEEAARANHDLANTSRSDLRWEAAKASTTTPARVLGGYVADTLKFITGNGDK